MIYITEKKKATYSLNSRIIEDIDLVYKEAGFKSRSELVEAAVDFYIGYLSSEDTSNYLPEVIDVSLKSIVGSLEDRTCNIMFKVAVELAMLLHVYASTNNITESRLNDLRDGCVKEVRSLNDIVTFKRALSVQKGLEE